MTRKISLGKAPKNAATVDKLFWTIPSNSTVTAKILVDADHLVDGYFCQHNGKLWAYSGDEDPCHDLQDVEPRFSILLPCLIKTPTGKEFKVIRGPQAIAKQIESLATTNNLRGLLVTITRKDERFAKYTVTPTGQRAKVEEDQDELVADILSKIKQGDSREIAEWLGINKNITEETL